MNKEIKIKFESINELMEEEKISIATFMLDRDSSIALDWLVETFNTSKQRIFEKLISEIVSKKTMIDLIHLHFLGIKNRIDKDIPKKEIYSISLKQRVRKNHLDKLSQICKEYEIPRNYLISESLTMFYDNIQSSLEKGDHTLKNLQKRVTDINANLNSIKRYTKRYYNLEKRYLNKIDKISDMIEKLNISIDKDILAKKIIKRNKGR